MKSPSVEAKAVLHPTLVWASQGHGPVLCITLAHHRSPPLVSPWKTQCAQSIQSWLDVRPWNGKASTGYGNGVVLALVPTLENLVLFPATKWVILPSGV